MTTVATTGAELLKMNEEDFNNAVKEMAIKDLMETISGLQKEMAKEQENFNSLSSELQNFKERNSRQYKQISKDLVSSQQRLTLLMNRSMKCFSQQNLHNSTDSALKRRNSAKGPKPVVTPASESSNLQRSKSLLAVNHIATTDLPSSFQSPQKGHLTDSVTSSQHSMHVSHMPVIMRTTANGGVNKSQEITITNNVLDRSKLQSKPTDAVNDSKDNALPKVSSSNESKTVTGLTGSVNRRDEIKGTGTDGLSSNTSASGGTGLYVKRTAAQQPRVITTTNISSSKFLPLSQPISSPPIPEPTTGTLFSTSSASSTCTHSSRPPTITAISSSANDPRFIKSKPAASQPEYVSPLQMAQSRKGVSKSQTFVQDTDNHGFRGLPSVKLLAQSFGSNTALNTIQGSSSSYNSSYTSRFVNTNKVVYRSNSSLNLTDPQSSAAVPQLIPKGNTGGGSEQTSQPEPALLINGKPQQLLTKQLNRVPQSPAPSINNEPNEFERTRTRLRSVGREITAETENGSVNSRVVAPITTNHHRVLPDKNPYGESNDEKVGENSRIGAYVKRKDTAPSRPLNSVQPSFPSVTVKSINSSSSLTPSTMTSTVPGTAPSLNQTSSQKVAATLSSDNSIFDNSKSILKPASKTPPANTQTLPANFVQKPQTPASPFSSRNRDNTSFTSSPHKEFGPRESVVSTAAVTIRRAKSREELQQIENDSRTNKDLVLQQIQARRRDHEADGDGSNFRAMSSMSRSMPSLLCEDHARSRNASSN